MSKGWVRPLKKQHTSRAQRRRNLFLLTAGFICFVFALFIPKEPLTNGELVLGGAMLGGFLIFCVIGFAAEIHSALPMSQELELFHSLASDLITQELVDARLTRLATRAQEYFDDQREALSKENIDSSDSPSQQKHIDECKFAVQHAKKNFWDFHGRARRAGFEVQNQIGDYLPKDNK